MLLVQLGFGLAFFIIRQKAKTRELMFKQQQQYANEEIYNLMLAQQNTIETGRIEEKKSENCTMAF
jgi:hypothetical protein